MWQTDPVINKFLNHIRSFSDKPKNQKKKTDHISKKELLELISMLNDKIDKLDSTLDDRILAIIKKLIKEE